MSPHHTDQMSQCSQVSGIALCVAKVKVTQWLSDSVTEWVTRSPIELFWTAKKRSRKKSTWLYAMAGERFDVFVGVLSLSENTLNREERRSPSKHPDADISYSLTPQLARLVTLKIPQWSYQRFPIRPITTIGYHSGKLNRTNHWFHCSTNK